MKLLKIEIPKSNLLSIPENERIFLIQFMNLLNDLNILNKLTYYSSKDTNVDVVRKAQNTQALLLIRIQAGKLFEGWKLLQKYFFGAKISKEMEGKLSGLGKIGLAELKKYFGTKDNIIHLIRDEFAFHYSPASSEKISKRIVEAPDSEVFEIFISEDHGNCLYHISHVLVMVAILKSLRCPDFWTAMDKLLEDVHKVTGWFLQFLGECLIVIFEKYLGRGHIEVEIPEPPTIDDVKLPFFVRKASF
jgi:hypothetical protein